jgi:hypothetical protein
VETAGSEGGKRGAPQKPVQRPIIQLRLKGKNKANLKLQVKGLK